MWSIPGTGSTSLNAGIRCPVRLAQSGTDAFAAGDEMALPRGLFGYSKTMMGSVVT